MFQGWGIEGVWGQLDGGSEFMHVVCGVYVWGCVELCGTGYSWTNIVCVAF